MAGKKKATHVLHSFVPPPFTWPPDPEPVGPIEEEIGTATVGPTQVERDYGNVAILPPAQLGDQVKDVGYVYSLRIDEPGHPGITNYMANPDDFAAESLETETYCVVALGRKEDSGESFSEFRILVSDFHGEELAVSMAVLAALKDAFVHRCRVRITGILTEKTYTRHMFWPGTSERFNHLRSVEMIRG